MSAVIIIAGFLISSSNDTKILAGIAAFVLFIGDFFHLAPRILAAFSKESNRFDKAIGIGKAITSINMTIFYVLVWLILFRYFQFDMLLKQISSTIIILLATIRIILCLPRKNSWITNEFTSYSIYRNIPFLLIGILVSIFYFIGYALYGGKLLLLPILILASFAFYLPVVLLAHKNPKIGILMLPKSLAYVGMLIMFLLI